MILRGTQNKPINQFFAVFAKNAFIENQSVMKKVHFFVHFFCKIFGHIKKKQ